MSLKKKCVSAKLNIISSILYAAWARRFGSLRCFVANCPVSKEWNTTMVSSRSQINIRSGPASVVSAEPILFPLPLCLRPRLHGFVVATAKGKYHEIIRSDCKRIFSISKTREYPFPSYYSLSCQLRLLFFSIIIYYYNL